MRAERGFPAGRWVAGLLVVGVMAASSGCGDSAGSALAEDPAAAKAQQEKERAAREAAYGKGGNAKPQAHGGKNNASKNSSKPG